MRVGCAAHCYGYVWWMIIIATGSHDKKAALGCAFFTVVKTGCFIYWGNEPDSGESPQAASPKLTA
jgi:hypothetical protein